MRQHAFDLKIWQPSRFFSVFRDELKKYEFFRHRMTTGMVVYQVSCVPLISTIRYLQYCTMLPV